jgi:hypothetical protein
VADPSPIHELSQAAQLLRDDQDGLFGPLAGPVSALLAVAAQRLHTQWLAWSSIPDGPEQQAENVFAAELTVARVVLTRAGRS